MRNRDVSSVYYVCKKNLCPELGLNSAWGSELLPTGLLGSVD